MTGSAIVFCVIPVHNRLVVTRRCIENLSVQDYPNLQIVIVDDGSNDGTSEYLTHSGLANLTVLKGDGNLWWGGAMHLGIAHVMAVAENSDYLLMLNDDVLVETDYVSTLVEESVEHEGSLIGSPQREEGSGRLLGCGCQIDYWGMRVLPILGQFPTGEVDALPGRGAFFPMSAVYATGNINVEIFPHYLGDLEYTARIKELGWNIIISRKASIYTSAENSDEALRQQGLKQEYFSFRSKNNISRRLWFFSLRGPIWLRFWAIPRYMLVGGWRLLKKVAT